MRAGEEEGAAKMFLACKFEAENVDRGPYK